MYNGGEASAGRALSAHLPAAHSRYSSLNQKLSVNSHPLGWLVGRDTSADSLVTSLMSRPLCLLNGPPWKGTYDGGRAFLSFCNFAYTRARRRVVSQPASALLVPGARSVSQYKSGPDQHKVSTYSVRHLYIKSSSEMASKALTAPASRQVNLGHGFEACRGGAVDEGRVFFSGHKNGPPGPIR